MHKKISLLAALAGVVMLTACEEKGPIIDFGTSEKAEDSTYVGAVAAAQPKKILVEEFTGATCPNCPDAQALLTNMDAQNPDRLAIMAIHVMNNPQTKPVKDSKYDFRTQDGTDIGTTFFTSINNLPSAGLDRVKNTKQERLMQKNDWAGALVDRLKIAPSVNMDMKSSYDATSRNASIEVKITYNKAMQGQQFLSLAVVEDDMVDKQDSTGVIIDQYRFKHVLRDYVTPVSGVTFLQDIAQKEAGRVYIRRFTYKVSDAWVPENCHLIAFVHQNNGEDKEVLQAVTSHVIEK